MSQRIKLRRGLHAALPTSGMLEGEPLVTTDRGNLHVATDATTKLPITPAIAELSAMGTIAEAADLLIMHDADATGQKERKITFETFKTALNIPAGSTDEKVAINSGATAGYLYGSGTDGVLRMGTSMSWAAGTGFVTLDVSVVDGGTFA
jgi:hypothetical protein